MEDRPAQTAEPGRNGGETNAGCGPTRPAKRAGPAYRLRPGSVETQVCIENSGNFSPLTAHGDQGWTEWARRDSKPTTSCSGA